MGTRCACLAIFRICVQHFKLLKRARRLTGCQPSKTQLQSRLRRGRVKTQCPLEFCNRDRETSRRHERFAQRQYSLDNVGIEQGTFSRHIKRRRPVARGQKSACQKPAGEQSAASGVDPFTEKSGGLVGLPLCNELPGMFERIAVNRQVCTCRC
jgi:hypothetical protein